jgi:hypothetical protein
VKSVNQVITCPKCDKKLAVREELKGRPLICPQCKGRFTVPTDGPEGVVNAPSQGGSEAAGPDMGFLDTLGPATGPGGAKTAARPATTPRTTAGKAATLSTAAKVKKKTDQTMLLYIGGGIAAVVLLVIVAVVAMSSSGSGGGKKEEKNMRFGLTESQRKRLFKDLISAVDENGSRNQYKEARAERRRLGGERQLNDQQIEDVFKEGMDRGWEQPEMAATMDQTQKTNRIDFFRTRHQMNRDPVMGK